MKALILNSGVGKRMGELTKLHPKCMSPIGGGYTILSWQLALLKEAGIEAAVISTGPFQEALRDHAAQVFPGAEFVHNPLYDKTNYIYSMYLARQLLDDDIILLHGDLVCEGSVIRDLIDSPTSAISVDSTLPLPDKDFKARLLDGRVAEIGVGVFGKDCVACQPAYKLLRSDMGAWMAEIGRFCESGSTGVYAENALNVIASGLTLRPMELGGRLCSEIDNLDDLRTVSAKFSNFLEGKNGI